MEYFENSTSGEYEGLPFFSNENFDPEAEIEEQIVTVQTDSDGYMVFSVFTPEQWEMAVHIAEVAEKDIQTVVTELSQDGDITTITIDPKDLS